MYFLLHSILCSFDLTQVVREPTRLATSGTATLIDLALMSNPSSLEVCSVIPPLSNSDHNGVSLTIKWKTANRKSRHRKIWKYLQADFQRACELIDATDWNTLLQSECIDQMWECWYKCFMSIMEQCIPRSTLPKGRKLPWVNGHIKHTIRKRNSFWRKSQQNPAYKLKYKQLRNKVVYLLREGKKTFVQNINPANPKQFWKIVKVLKGKNSSSILVIKHNGKVLTSDQQKADVFNKFFHSCFNTALPPLCPNTTKLEPSDCPENLLCSEQEVMEIIASLNIFKASGPDQISVRMIKGTASSIAPVLAQFFNVSIKSGRIPSAWKASIIVPIPKGPSNTDPSNYRPISLLSVISKMLEKIICDRVLRNLETSCPPPSIQPMGISPWKINYQCTSVSYI